MDTLPNSEYEDMLRHGFVEMRADRFCISSRRQDRAIAAANYGIDQGWLTGDLDTTDVQSSVWTLRLTDKGREHFGLVGKGGVA